MAANMRRIYNPQVGRHGGPLTWVTGSRPLLLQVVYPTWLARFSIPVGFLVARLIQSLAFLKCTFYQLEWFLCAVASTYLETRAVVHTTFQTRILRAFRYQRSVCWAVRLRYHVP
jgi:hypothetical protein